jgi:membrane-associated protease RseP (regulator of RpoE activity)
MSRTHLIQLLLFFITLGTTTLAGAEWLFGSSFLGAFRPMGWPQFWAGLQFSLPFLGVLTVHEFGHYFTARANRVRVSLPYYLPLWLGISTTIGTLGAFIRIRERIRSNRQYFDIGIAGPLAGFVAALGLLWYGFTHLPPPEYIFTIHPEYQQFGLKYFQYVYRNPQPGTVQLGDNLLFYFFKTYVATDPARVPNPFEIIHYPYLFAGYLALFFTALNLIPIGQLDGGHILYGLLGERGHRLVSPVLFVGFVFYAGLGQFRFSDFDLRTTEAGLYQWGYLLIYLGVLFWTFSRLHENRLLLLMLAAGVVLGQLTLAYFVPGIEGYVGFLPFMLILGRFLGVYHPPAAIERPLDPKRRVLGWLALLIFVLCFSPKPFLVTG